MSILEIRDLNVTFPTPGGDVKAVRNTSFDVIEGETFGLIGESGSGKSVIGLALLRLLPHNAIVSGEIRFKSMDILSLSERRNAKDPRQAHFPDAPKPRSIT